MSQDDRPSNERYENTPLGEALADDLDDGIADADAPKPPPKSKPKPMRKNKG